MRRIPGAPAAGSQHRGELWRGLGEAWTAISYLVCGIVFWGGAGYLLDGLLGTRPALFAAGVLLGNAGGTYLIYLRWMKGTGRRDAS